MSRDVTERDSPLLPRLRADKRERLGTRLGLFVAVASVFAEVSYTVVCNHTGEKNQLGDRENGR